MQQTCRCRRVQAEDGSHFILNGEKRYITNAAIAHVLTVMARTPVPGSDKTAITAFLVTPDMPGFDDARSAHAEDGNPRHSHGTIRAARCQSPKGKYSRPAWVKG